jgi:hypothetical protein
MAYIEEDKKNGYNLMHQIITSQLMNNFLKLKLSFFLEAVVPLMMILNGLEILKNSYSKPTKITKI